MVRVCASFFPMLLYYHNNSCNRPFLSTNWHQKEPLGYIVYSHCPTNDSYNNSIHSCCLPCNYVTKPFGILQRVIKSQRVHISEKSLMLLSTIYFFHQMIVHDKRLDTKEKLKLTFYSYLIIKTSSFQKKSFMATRSRSQTNFSKKKLWQYQNSHLHLHQKEEIVLHYLQFSP